MLILIGDRLAQMGQFTDAIPSFQRAIKLEEAHLGSRHIQLGLHLHMLAQAQASVKRYGAARVSVQKAIDIFQEQPDADKYKSDLSRALWLLNYCDEHSLV